MDDERGQGSSEDPLGPYLTASCVRKLVKGPRGTRGQRPLIGVQ